MNEEQFDILIIGAGAAGLMAARELLARGKKVAVAEALPHTGGRMHTVSDRAFEDPVELGAEFVHGNLALTKSLLHEAGIMLMPVHGSMWQCYGNTLQQQEGFIDEEDFLDQQLALLDTDMPVSLFLKQKLPGKAHAALRLSLKGYVEGYYAADADKASTKALKADLEREEEDQYRVAGGYRTLARHLEQQCRDAGATFYLVCPVWQLHWQSGGINAVTPQGSIRASKAIVTVSVGVLQQEGITFFPALPQKTAAAKALGFGHVVKVNLQFRDAFWKNEAFTKGKNLHDLFFLFSAQEIPTWWTQHPGQSAVLTGWIAGPGALAFKECSEVELTQKALLSLSAIFDLTLVQLAAMLLGVQVHNWSADAFFEGAYSYEVVNGAQHIKTLLEPVADTLFFAGEGLHTGPEIGTVEAALASGKEVAERVSKVGRPERQ